MDKSNNFEARRKAILDRFTLECGKYLPGNGWLDILERLIKTLDETGIRYDVAQIKEKFGTLRFYVNIIPMDIEVGSYSSAQYGWFRCAIQLAELESHITCERCGDYGTQRSGGWLRTLCDECENEYQKSKEGTSDFLKSKTP